ncbi:MAG TPA: hypothetical protein VF772_23210, partial [Terriglobales bacterium]
MDEKPDPNYVTNPAPPGVSREAQELIRDWEFLFSAFLLFGLGKLAWLYLHRPEHTAFHLGLVCGSVFCGVLWFLMRWVFSP